MTNYNNFIQLKDMERSITQTVKRLGDLVGKGPGGNIDRTGPALEKAEAAPTPPASKNEDCIIELDEEIIALRDKLNILYAEQEVEEARRAEYEARIAEYEERKVELKRNTRQVYSQRDEKTTKAVKVRIAELNRKIKDARIVEEARRAERDRRTRIQFPYEEAGKKFMSEEEKRQEARKDSPRSLLHHNAL